MAKFALSGIAHPVYWLAINFGMNWSGDRSTPFTYSWIMIFSISAAYCSLLRIRKSIIIRYLWVNYSVCCITMTDISGQVDDLVQAGRMFSLFDLDFNFLCTP